MGNVEAFEEIMRVAKAPVQPLGTVIEPGLSADLIRTDRLVP
jgi:hypothetical protein